MRPRGDATHAFAAEGMAAGISAWLAKRRNRLRGLGLTEVEEKLHGGLVSAGKERELCAQEKFDVFEPG